jgi:hypothetical protein
MNCHKKRYLERSDFGEARHHGTKEVTRRDIIGGGDAVVGGGDAIGGEVLLEETLWEESCHGRSPCGAVLMV